jgi:exonuclease SbcD
VRILHTSDWHLGRSFHGVDLLGAQAAVLEHLVEVVRSEQVDLVIVAGDVYDRALPSVDAVQVLDDGLARLVGTGTQVVLTSGNHDSARRLGFGSRLLDRAGLHVRTEPARCAEPVLLPDEHGTVAIYPLPYLEPAVVAGSFEAERSHAGVLGAAAAAVRADLATRPAGTRSVLAAHAFVTGGAPSESERELAVGGLGQVPASLFAGLDYVALGHLHGRQRLAENVRYSGSPLAFSFSEAGHTKGSWLVELGATGLGTVLPVDSPVPRPLARLRGTLAELLADPQLAFAESAWCQVTLTDPQRPAAPMDQLRRRFGHVLELRFDPTGAQAEGGSAASYSARTAGHTDLEVCCGFLEHVRQRECSPAERQLLTAAFDAVILADAEGFDPASLERPGMLPVPRSGSGAGSGSLAG